MWGKNEIYYVDYLEINKISGIINNEQKKTPFDINLILIILC